MGSEEDRDVSLDAFRDWRHSWTWHRCRPRPRSSTRWHSPIPRQKDTLGSRDQEMKRILWTLQFFCLQMDGKQLMWECVFAISKNLFNCSHIYSFPTPLHPDRRKDTSNKNRSSFGNHGPVRCNSKLMVANKCSAIDWLVCEVCSSMRVLWNQNPVWQNKSQRKVLIGIWCEKVDKATSIDSG